MRSISVDVPATGDQRSGPVLVKPKWGALCNNIIYSTSVVRRLLLGLMHWELLQRSNGKSGMRFL